MISFIVPAHNEELWIRKCLGSIRATMEKLAEPYEVIVVQALKKVGRFVVLKPKVLSSGRKLNVVSPWQVLGVDGDDCHSRPALREQMDFGYSIWTTRSGFQETNESDLTQTVERTGASRFAGAKFNAIGRWPWATPRPSRVFRAM
jgi:hypothetical protein